MTVASLVFLSFAKSIYLLGCLLGLHILFQSEEQSAPKETSNSDVGAPIAESTPKRNQTNNATVTVGSPSQGATLVPVGQLVDIPLQEPESQNNTADVSF